jgi:hypothetical protein
MMNMSSREMAKMTRTVTFNIDVKFYALIEELFEVIVV